MEINLVVLGLALDIIGVLILVVVSILNPSYRKREDLKWWEKRYSWDGWRPIYRNTKTLKWKVKLNSIVVKHWFIPPKHLENIIGFLFILAGFILQLISYLS